MSNNQFYSDQYLRNICLSVKQQLQASDAIRLKVIQLKISQAQAAELLNTFIDELLKNCTKRSAEYKNLTGWILCDSVKKRFLDL